jgi:2,3-bisphosphoglycerate-independent phosphoglycerate mutase
MGNSEVGHLNLGAGRMVPQDLLRIDLTLRDGSFYENPALAGAADRARDRGAALHVMGLVSDGGVHSHVRHLYGLIELAKRRKVPRLFVHVFTDGRDTPPRSALNWVSPLEERLAEVSRSGLPARVATVTGRYFAMDRDERWDRVEKAWAALRSGVGRTAPSAEAAIKGAYAAGEDDEFIQPTVVVPDGADFKSDTIRDGDSAIFFDFRADRARQLTRVLTDPAFDGFARGSIPDVHLVTFTQYKEEFAVPVAFPPVSLHRILAEVWAEHGVANVRIAETEKYAHVTYFFNGGVERAFPGEERVLVPSWRGGATYDLHPQMSAREITAEVVRALDEKRAPALVVNYANADMVGHTGKLDAAISAIETLDGCFGQIEAAASRAGAILAMTADHGNAEQMIDPATGGPHTAHTTNPVPFVLVNVNANAGASLAIRLRPGALSGVAPTLLRLQGIEAPPEMTGASLLA